MFIRRNSLSLYLNGLFNSLLFYVTGDNNVNFAKLNGLTPRGMAKCNIYMDQVVSLALDLSRQRVYWATVTHDKVIVNWADYADENCINMYEIHNCLFTYVYPSSVILFIRHCS